MSRAGFPITLALALLFGFGGRAEASVDPASVASLAVEKELQAFLKEGREHPEEYLERAERAWLRLGDGPAREWTGGGADALAPMPEGHVVVRELRAYYLRQLALEYEAMTRERAAATLSSEEPGQGRALRGHYLRIRKLYGKSANRLLAGSEPSHYYGPGMPRFLAEVALLRRDTAEAAEAYRRGWKDFGLEEDFVSLLDLQRARGERADALLEEGLRAHPLSPAVYAAVFAAYMQGPAGARLEGALKIANRAQSELWPSSVDWKIHYAQALLANELPEEARTALLAALELADRETQLKIGKPMAAQARQEIFALLRETGP